jgi:hypothetical protein
MTHEMPSGPDAKSTPQSPRASSSEPAASLDTTLPSAEDPEASTYTHKQKRPRLDSGSRTVRSLSADPILSPQPSTDSAVAMDSDSTLQNSSPVRPSSRITLHVRSQQNKAVEVADLPPSSQTEKGSRRDSVASSLGSPVDRQAEDEEHSNPQEPGPVDETAENGIKPPPPPASPQPGHAPNSPIEIGSSRGVPIEIADPEDIETTPTIEAITIEGEDDDMVEQFIYNFPYRHSSQKPIKAAQSIIRHLEQDSDVEKDLLSNLIRWLRELDIWFSHPGQKRYLDELFYNHLSLWEHVALIFQRLLNRS